MVLSYPVRAPRSALRSALRRASPTPLQAQLCAGAAQPGVLQAAVAPRGPGPGAARGARATRPPARPPPVVRDDAPPSVGDTSNGHGRRIPAVPDQEEHVGRGSPRCAGRRGGADRARRCSWRAPSSTRSSAFLSTSIGPTTSHSACGTPSPLSVSAALGGAAAGTFPDTPARRSAVHCVAAAQVPRAHARGAAVRCALAAGSARDARCQAASFLNLSRATSELPPDCEARGLLVHLCAGATRGGWWSSTPCGPRPANSSRPCLPASRSGALAGAHGRELGVFRCRYGSDNLKFASVNVGTHTYVRCRCGGWAGRSI